MSIKRTISNYLKRFYSPWDDYWYGAVSTPAISGVDVDEYTALKNTTVWACVRVISETIASLPLFVYRRFPDGGKEKAVNHRLYNILHLQPNSEMTSFQLREIMMSHILPCIVTGKQIGRASCRERVYVLV